jgi:hypothetical protein
VKEGQLQNFVLLFRTLIYSFGRKGTLNPNFVTEIFSLNLLFRFL